MRTAWNGIMGVVAATILIALGGCVERSQTSGSASEDPSTNRVLVVVEELALGAELEATPEYQFYDVLDLLALQDGDAWVIDGDDRRRIRRFDATGTYLGEVSRQGDGPGETSSPRALAQLPDGTVALLDLGRPGRLELFDPEGRWLRTHRFDDPIPWAGSGSFMADRSGTLWLPALGSEPERGSGGLRWLRAEGLSPELEPVPTPDLQWLRPDGVPEEDEGVVRAPYVPDLRVSRGPSGHLWAAWSGAYRIHRLSGGTPSRAPAIDRDHGDRIAVPAAERRAADEGLAAIVEDFGTPGMPIPEVPAVKPALRELQATVGGYLIVRPHAASVFDGREWGEPTILDVFDIRETPPGYLGRVTLDGEHEVLEAGDGRLWTLHRDALGVESIHRYRLEPAPR